MVLKIRKIENKDLDYLAEVYNQTYSPDIFDVGERWTKESAHKMLSYWLERNSDLAFLAEEDNKIIAGFFVDVKPWWDGNHLIDGEIFVHPDYQKKGIGTELSKFLYNLAIKRYKAIKFDAFTFKKSDFPLKWYKKQGFKEVKEWIIISGELKKILKKLKNKSFE